MKRGRGDRARWAQLIIGAVGLSLAFVGWNLDHWEGTDWVAAVFAPGHTRALATYERMLESGSAIGPADPGFAEIASLLAETLSGPGDLTIASLEARGGTIGFKPDIGYVGPTVALTVTLQDGRSVSKRGMKDLRPAITQRFLQDPLLQRGRNLVLLSIFLGLCALVIEFYPVLKRVFSQVYDRTRAVLGGAKARAQTVREKEEG